MGLWLVVGFVFVILALGFSLFFGCKACEIFSVPRPGKKSQRFYLFWFNFCGSLVGWGALWLIIFKVVRCLEISCPAEISFGDLLLALVAFAGITGHVPMSTMGNFNSLAEVARNVLKKFV